MKQMRMVARLAALILAGAAIIALAGCGGGSNNGSTSYTMGSEWHGTLAGVATEPALDDIVYTDSWIHISWPDENLAPPAQFTFRLEKEEHPNDWGKIHTRYRDDYSNPKGGSWWFEPVNQFSTYTNYRIVLIDTADPDTQYIVNFDTAGGPDPDPYSLSRSAALLRSGSVKKFRPAGAENAAPLTGDGAVDQVIRTGRK